MPVFADRAGQSIDTGSCVALTGPTRGSVTSSTRGLVLPVAAESAAAVATSPNPWACGPSRWLKASAGRGVGRTPYLALCRIPSVAPVCDRGVLGPPPLPHSPRDANSSSQSVTISPPTGIPHTKRYRSGHLEAGCLLIFRHDRDLRYEIAPCMSQNARCCGSRRSRSGRVLRSYYVTTCDSA